MLSRHFSTCKLLCNLSSLIRKRENISFLTHELCNQILDRYPELRLLKKLHSRIIFDAHLSLNPSIGIKLMRAYSACADPVAARRVFDQVADKNVVFFNVMIRSFMSNHMCIEALSLFKSMSGYGCDPDHYTYPCVLKACVGIADSGVGLQVHAAIVKVGLESNLFNGNGLVSMYGKCGFLLEARQVLDEMPFRDVVSWNTIVSGYAANGLFDKALDVCREMEMVRMQPDAGTLASLLPAATNTTSDNVLYIKRIFSKLLNKSLVSWNVMIGLYVNNSMPAEAIDHFLQMETYGVEPDAVTFASVLPACGDVSALIIGKKIHECVERKRLMPNLLLENALIDMYAKCGCLEEARRVFDGMKIRDVASWTSMICAYGMTGQGHAAVSLFSKMQVSGLVPDSIAFVSIISACSHAGLLNEGRTYFKQMTEKHGIVAKIEHYACMVDLLGRNAQIKEAYDFVKHMPMEPNERVWGALLSACCVHSNMTVGVLAADHIFHLKPQQSGYYVLLSNIYAKAGRWEAVMKVRSIMRSRGIKKVPGISNVELGGRVHTFLAGDRSHPQSDKIYEELEALMAKMKELGYVPETESALHDVEEEDKEAHLAVHSEKLAIVFALLNTDSDIPIRITKNLRVCLDCHVAIKLISDITKRDIIVRDNNRFHHFSKGICSCGEYW
ncbi:unnamed protein product [Rhodiola kirilowii]